MILGNSTAGPAGLRPNDGVGCVRGARVRALDVMGPPIDETAWPLIVVRWSGTVVDADLDGLLARMERWLAKGERFGLLIDSRGARGLSPEQRVRLIETMKRQSELTSRYLIQAIVIDNLIQRTLFYGINLIFPNPFPSKVFAEPEAARSWLLQMLGAPARVSKTL